MTDPVSIQQSSAAQGQGGSLTLPGARPGLNDSFASLLSCLCQEVAPGETPLPGAMLQTGGENGVALVPIVPLPVGLAVPPGPAISAAPAGSPAVAKTSLAAAGARSKSAKAGEEDKASAAQDEKVAPEMILAAGDLAAQPLPVPAPFPEPMIPAPAFSPPAVPDSGADDARRDALQNGLQSHRSAASDLPGSQSIGSVSPGGGAASSLAALSDAPAEKFAVKSETFSDMAALSARAGAVQVAPPQIAVPPFLQSAEAVGRGHSDHPSPVDQVAPVMVGLLKAADGSPTVMIHLQPPELGQVSIRVEQTTAGSHIGITVDRPETLLLLQRDEPRLQQTLDLAGVPSSGRSVSFEVAPDPVGAAAARPDTMAPGSGGSGHGQSGGAWRQNSDLTRDFGRGQGSDQRQAQTRWFRAGLDITA